MSLLFKRTAESHRRAGDVERDTGRWDHAAAAYRRHLAEHPGDAAIYVQLGHVEKEAGRFAEAETAYRQAAQIAPADPDPLLHLAHMLKRLNRQAPAMETFRALFRLNGDESALAEIRLLARERRDRGAVVARPGSVMLVMQDFFSSFDAHRTPTGIQRTQAGIVLAAIEDATLDLHIIVNDEETDEVEPSFLRIDADTIRQIIAYVTSGSVDQTQLRALLLDARLGGDVIVPDAGSTIVILGAFWGPGNGIERFLDARRRGARVAAYLHDIIPVTHPEFCDLNLSNAFWRGLAGLLHIADFALTNSDHTRHELQRWAVARGARSIPMRTAPPAHTLAPDFGSRGIWPDALRSLRKSRYVAYVSTIEGRKNHVYVIRAWQRLIAAGVAVPDLVFVGRLGWRMDALTQLLADTDYLGGRVHIVSGLSDGELAEVYRHAMFTVFTSVVEGWGLPVGESLAHGIPCIASKTASIPEVGGEFVDYVDPDDLDDGLRVFRRMIEDETYRLKRKREIETRFRPRSWQEAGEDFVSKLKEMLAVLPPASPIAPITLPEGQVFRPGDQIGRASPTPGYFEHPFGLVLTSGFYGAEPAGAWMRGAFAEISFGTTVASGEGLVVLLALNAAPWAVGALCSFELVDAARGQRPWFSLNAGQNLIRIEGVAGPDGSCSLIGRYHGPLPAHIGDNRRFGIGLGAIGYCRLAEHAARRELREQFLFA